MRTSLPVRDALYKHLSFPLPHLPACFAGDAQRDWLRQGHYLGPYFKSVAYHFAWAGTLDSKSRLLACREIERASKEIEKEPERRQVKEAHASVNTRRRVKCRFAYIR